MGIKRKFILRLALALILAVIIGRYLGRAIAWYDVYSQPAQHFIKIHPVVPNKDGDFNQEKRGQQQKRLAI
jgi:hypothetical protein